ncbi:MAG: 1-deoxy-D-xylulose-5-phosphate synthase [Opitutales bacterium]|nr:1-deoxy-D-xylulose-5-phosphate synthase [Opitutales bacterium]
MTLSTSFSYLRAQARQIRQQIETVTRRNGGHLASNLGLVELTLALHEVFRSPRDQIIFDVSHQCYAHKLLTGRESLFSTLRQTGGLSGFTSPAESIHDHFFCGHAGTALSLALGLAKARDLHKDDHHVIAVLGDASLTNGLTLEALNNIGSTKLIIVLNDNGYAIAPNVGFIARYLKGLILSTPYNRTKTWLKNVLRKIWGGKQMIHGLSALKRALKALVLPSSFFEYYGLRYIGPIDGHNLEELVDALEFCKQETKPVLLHIKTQKGYGGQKIVTPEEHSISPTPTRGYSQTLGHTLCQLAEKNKKIVAITAAMSTGTGLQEFQKKFPQNFFDVGIAEGHAVTFAAGLAKMGFIPVCAIYSTFLQRAFDNIFHDVALQNLPVIFAIDRAGLCAHDGPTHHGLFDLAWLNAVPNLIIMQPSDTEELTMMLTAAITWNRPCAIRYPRTTATKPQSHTPIQIGRSEILQEGQRIALIALGEKVATAQEVTKKLSCNCTIINARFVKPLDEALLRHCAEKHDYLYILEDHVATNGSGSTVTSFFQQNQIPVHLHCFAWPDQFLPHATNDADLLTKYHLTADDIVEKILQDLRS